MLHQLNIHLTPATIRFGTGGSGGEGEDGDAKFRVWTIHAAAAAARPVDAEALEPRNLVRSLLAFLEEYIALNSIVTSWRDIPDPLPPFRELRILDFSESVSRQDRLARFLVVDTENGYVAVAFAERFITTRRFGLLVSDDAFWSPALRALEENLVPPRPPVLRMHPRPAYTPETPFEVKVYDILRLAIATDTDSGVPGRYLHWPELERDERFKVSAVRLALVNGFDIFTLMRALSVVPAAKRTRRALGPPILFTPAISDTDRREYRRYNAARRLTAPAPDSKIRDGRQIDYASQTN